MPVYFLETISTDEKIYEFKVESDKKNSIRIRSPKVSASAVLDLIKKVKKPYIDFTP